MNERAAWLAVGIYREPPQAPMGLGRVFAFRKFMRLRFAHPVSTATISTTGSAIGMSDGRDYEGIEEHQGGGDDQQSALHVCFLLVCKSEP
jgi:hypothetical protein